METNYVDYVPKLNRNGKMVFFLFLCYVPQILPYSVYYVLPYSTVDWLTAISFCLLFFNYVLICRNNLLKKINPIIVIMLGYLVFTTYINGQELMEVLKLFVGIGACFMYLKMGFKLNKKNTLKYLAYYYISIVFINSAIMLILQGSMFVGNDVNNQWNFMGADNYMGCIIVPALFIVLSYFEKYTKARPFRTFVLYVLFAFSILFAQSSTSMVAVVVCGLLYLLLRRDDSVWNNVLSYRRLILIILAGFYFLTIAGSTIFQSISVNILGESSTFHGRTKFWALALTQIQKSLWLGYGYGMQAFSSITYGYNNAYSTTPHSGYLTLLLYGGIPLLFIFFLILLRGGNKLIGVWNKSSEKRILSIGLIGILIICLAEWNVFRTPCLWIILIIFDLDINQNRSTGKSFHMPRIVLSRTTNVRK